MKKLLFMFLAISAIGYSATETGGVKNKENTTETSTNGVITTTAKVDVEIKAEVRGNEQLVIEDMSGNEISYINFVHNLRIGEIQGQVEQNLNIGIKAVSSLIGTQGTEKFTVEFSDPNYSLEKTDNSGKSLLGNLSSVNAGSGKGYKNYTIHSKLNSQLLTADDIGDYGPTSGTLTITLNKTPIMPLTK